MIVLGVETSCDETAVAIVKDGKEVISVCFKVYLVQPSV